MFYAHFVLAKKGPLARIWLAAHWDKKLTKAHVFETNIESSVEGILQPKVKMALRTSGHLLLGIVRIYSRKAKYLLADCNEAFIKIKMAFRPGVVDLPEGNREAAVATITLPEVFHDFDTAMPDITIDMDAQVSLNQSRAEDITLKEDYGTLSLMADDGFGDMGFDDPEVARDATNIDEGFDHASLLLCDDPSKEKVDESLQSGSTSAAKSKQSTLDANLKDEAFAGGVEDGLLDGESAGLFEPAGLFDDAPLGHVTLDNTPDQVENQQPGERPAENPEDSDDDMYDMGPGSVGAPSPPSSPESPSPGEKLPDGSAHPEVEKANGLLPGNVNDLCMPAAAVLPEAAPAVPNEMPPPAAVLPSEHPPVLHNEEESFALAPLDATIIQGAERTVKTKRKRKLIVDEVKNISGEEMKAQLSDTTDIVTTLDLAPPTKRLMHWKETGGVEKLFALPGHPILSKTLSRMYQRHLTTRSVDNEDFGADGDHIDLDADVEQARDDEGIACKRRREMEPPFPHDPSQFDRLHADASHPSFAQDLNMQQQSSVDVSANFLPQHMFSGMSDQAQQSLTSPMMSISPQTHMVQHVMPSDASNTSHLPSLVHSTTEVEQVNQAHMPASNSMQDVPASVSESFAQPPSSANAEPAQHLLPDLPEIQENTCHPSEKSTPAPEAAPPVSEDQINHSCADQVETAEKTLLPACVNGPTEPQAISDVLPTEDIVPPFPEETHIVDKQPATELPANDKVLPSAERVCNSVEQLPSDDSFTSLSKNNANSPEVNHIPNKVLRLDVNSQEAVTTDSVSDNLTTGQKLTDFQQSDEDDDYGAPASVGPMMPEEQMADETYEQFEERILTKRTTHMLHIIHSQLETAQGVKFSSVIRNNKRKQVAQKFYTFLVLKKQQAVELQQNEPYGEMIITKGPKYNAVYNAN